MLACTFIGHRDFPQSVYEKLYIEIEKLILFKNVNVFYVGTNGMFDDSVYRVLCDLKKKHTIEIRVTLAYLNQKNTDKYLTNETVFPSVLEKTPNRYAISKRNMFMIKKSQYMICYLRHTFSNTYTFVKKAKRNNLTIINIGDYGITEI